jgi:hypothetical protein
MGFFWFGPYTPLPPGDYTATLRLKTGSNAPADLLTIDIAANGGKKILASQDINSEDFEFQNAWQNLTIRFGLDKPVSDIEIRGIVSSTGSDVWLDYMVIRQTLAAEVE